MACPASDFWTLVLNLGSENWGRLRSPNNQSTGIPPDTNLFVSSILRFYSPKRRKLNPQEKCLLKKISGNKIIDFFR
jgi:hypothetical protein